MRNVDVGVAAVGAQFLQGDVASAREARTAVEDLHITVNYKHQVVQWLLQGLITVDEVQSELEPEEARAVLLAAGVGIPELPRSADAVIDGESRVLEADA